ncbi:hypothetical protein KKG71_07065 [Patescibacteria group bacterium]|nr:hypothetical protein [Patescibacteria group bacterium]
MNEEMQIQSQPKMGGEQINKQPNLDANANALARLRFGTAQKLATIISVLALNLVVGAGITPNEAKAEIIAFSRGVTPEKMKPARKMDVKKTAQEEKAASYAITAIRESANIPSAKITKSAPSVDIKTMISKFMKYMRNDFFKGIEMSTAALGSAILLLLGGIISKKIEKSLPPKNDSSNQ